MRIKITPTGPDAMVTIRQCNIEVEDSHDAVQFLLGKGIDVWISENVFNDAGFTFEEAYDAEG